MSTTLKLRSVNGAIEAPAPWFADALGALTVSVQKLMAALTRPAGPRPDASAELLRLAAAYESTQPSYAADLRAAAQRAGFGDHLD